MKSIKLFLIMAFAISSVSCMGGDLDKKVSFNNLPKVSQDFVNRHFKDIKVSRVIKDMDDLTYTWDVYFVNGWELEFLKGGEWKKIDCERSAVPESVLALLPEGIVTYCTQKYPNTYITEIDKDRKGYDIELSNGVSLDFDTKGKFIRIDN